VTKATAATKAGEKLLLLGKGEEKNRGWWVREIQKGMGKEGLYIKKKTREETINS